MGSYLLISGSSDRIHWAPKSGQAAKLSNESLIYRRLGAQCPAPLTNASNLIPKQQERGVVGFGHGVIQIEMFSGPTLAGWLVGWLADWRGSDRIHLGAVFVNAPSGMSTEITDAGCAQVLTENQRSLAHLWRFCVR